MKTRLILKPGQKGTQAMMRKYGERLLAVRYRYDEASSRRLKTVELVEEELPWQPPLTVPPEQPVYLRIAYEETDLRETVRRVGGRWRPERKAWELPYGMVRQIGLEVRILKDSEASAPSNQAG